MSSDGSRVAIGGPYNIGYGDYEGHVRVYEYSNGVWGKVGNDIIGAYEYDYSGDAVSLSSDGSRVAIGAMLGSNEDGDFPGNVRIFEFSNGVWTQVGADIYGEEEDDLFGYTVSMSSDGSRVAIGASGNDSKFGNGDSSGHVRVYEYSNGVWKQMGADIYSEAEDDEFGYSVSMSSDGSRVAIGAPYNDGNGDESGHVRVYEYSNGAWTQVGADIDGEAAGDELGDAVSLSSDGSRVAIGASGNDSNGLDSGHVRVYEYSNGAWTQVGADIDGEGNGDYSGYSVSMSSDGSRVAIGAPYNDGNGDESGHVRVYEYSNGAWTPSGSRY